MLWGLRARIINPGEGEYRVEEELVLIPASHEIQLQFVKTRFSSLLCSWG